MPFRDRGLTKVHGSGSEAAIAVAVPCMGGVIGRDRGVFEVVKSSKAFDQIVRT